MLTELRLSGNELLCYALIYGYSQSGAGGFFGSRSQLAEALNISRRSATDILDRLLEKGLIEMKHILIDNVQRCLYSAALLNDEKDIDEMAVKSQAAMPKVSIMRMRPPTLQEVREYCFLRKNDVDAQRFYDFYSANGWVQGRGKPIKDWKAAIRTWERGNELYKTLSNGRHKGIMQAERRKSLFEEVAEIDSAYRSSSS